MSRKGQRGIQGLSQEYEPSPVYIYIKRYNTRYEVTEFEFPTMTESRCECRPWKPRPCMMVLFFMSEIQINKSRQSKQLSAQRHRDCEREVHQVHYEQEHEQYDGTHTEC